MRVYLSVILLALSFSCGNKNASLYLNENAPTGTIIFQGQFLTPATVTGTVQLYNSSGQIIVRFQGLTTPTDTRYFFYLEQSGSPTIEYTTQLKAPQGNQNYATGLSVGHTYTRLVFRGNTNPASPEISSATLVSVP